MNVHNATVMGGAIRGQLATATEPPDTALPLTDGSPLLLGVLLVLAAAIGLGARRPLVERG